MSDKYKTHCKPCKRQARERNIGVTLMEVMAGLALLATVLVVVLQIEARYRHQAARAQRRAAAVRVADGLLTEWWQAPKGIPQAASGVATADTGFSWRTAPVADATVSELGGQIVRLEVFDAHAAEPLARPLIMTDVVVSNNLRGGQQSR